MDLAAPIPPIDAELVDHFAMLERSWVHAWVSAVPVGPRETLGLRWRTIDDGNDVIVCDALPHMICNRVVGHGLADPPAMIRATTALRPDNALVVLASGDRVAAAARVLGLQPFRRDSQVLVRGTSLAAHVPIACRIERADRRHHDAIAAIFGEAFALPDALAMAMAHAIEHPSVHGYLALDGDTVVAVALMLVVGHHAYFAGAATQPSARGRGLHDALIARRIAVARALGVQRIFVDTGTPVAGEPSPSLDNLRHAGFAPLFVRPQWSPPGATWTGPRQS